MVQLPIALGKAQTNDEKPFLDSFKLRDEHMYDEPAHNSRHAYTSLARDNNEVRLVRILTKNEDSINREIESYELHHAPSYTALSYRWGRKSSDCYICIGGRKLFVRKNLWRFLKMALDSHRYVGRYLWIDAICIDQSNAEERNHQVGMMAEIFKTAAQVVVWLGPSYADSAVAFRTLSRYARREPKPNMWTTNEGSAIRRVCQRQYWTRLWVLQELVLAKNVVLTCGSEELTWTKFTAFLECVHRSEPVLRDVEQFEYRALLQTAGVAMSSQVQNAHRENSLIEQLLASQHLECYEKRDKIFGLLGIVASGHNSIRPDYSATITKLLNDVLRNEHEVRPPASIQQVAKQCQLIAAAVDIDLSLMLDNDDQVDSDGRPLVTLHWAAHHSHEAVLRLLNVPNNDDLEKTFLAAAATGDLTVLSTIVERLDINLARIVTTAGCRLPKTSLHRTASGGMNALHLAAEYGHLSIIQYLLAMNNSFTGSYRNTNALRSTAVHYASAASYVPESRKTSVRWTDVLDGHGRSPLYLATNSGHTDAVRLLMSHSSVNCLPRGSISLLHVAVLQGHAKTAEYLVDHEAIDPNAGVASILGTALYVAAKARRDDIVTILLRSGRVAPNMGRASWKHHHESPLFVAVKWRCRSTVACLLRCSKVSANGALDEASDLPNRHFNNVPLHQAATNSEDIMDMLLQRPDIDINAIDEQLEAPGSVLQAAVTASTDRRVAMVAKILARPDLDLSDEGVCGHCILDSVRADIESTEKQLKKSYNNTSDMRKWISSKLEDSRSVEKMLSQALVIWEEAMWESVASEDEATEENEGTAENEATVEDESTSEDSYMYDPLPAPRGMDIPRRP